MSSTDSFSITSARVREFIRACEPEGRATERTASTDPLRASEITFNDLALEIFALQFEHNAAYRALCRARDVSPEKVEHWTQIPAAPTSAFKEFELTCLPAAARTTVFHSSGTTEHRPSRHFHNRDSLALYEVSFLEGFNACVASSQSARARVFPLATPGHLLILTPPRPRAPHSSLLYMFDSIRRACGALESAFTGRIGDDGAWSLDLDAVLETLAPACGAHVPLAVFGTAFSFVHLLDHLEARELGFKLPPGSLALETGGYKGRSRTLPKAELHRLITQRLGIPAGCIICEYGMSELSSQAYAPTPGLSPITQEASFLFPPWARAQIICPETGREVRDGESGSIRVFDLANVYSVLALQTEDLAIRRGAGFELLGRAARAEPRGCSLQLADAVPG